MCAFIVVPGERGRGWGGEELRRALLIPHVSFQYPEGVCVNCLQVCDTFVLLAKLTNLLSITMRSEEEESTD